MAQRPAHGDLETDVVAMGSELGSHAPGMDIPEELAVAADSLRELGCVSWPRSSRSATRTITDTERRIR